MNKKKILGALAVLAIAAMAAYHVNVNTRGNGLSDVSLANVEALAENEGSSGTCKWKNIDCPGWGSGNYEACLVNGDGYSCTCGNVSRNCE
jgi:hypothetical protein